MTVADLGTLAMSDFDTRRDETFVVQTQPEIHLQLTHVRPLGDSGRPGGAFSLWFMGEPGPFLPQSIYPVVHPQLGQLNIFLVPLGPRDGKNLYETIFT